MTATAGDIQGGPQTLWRLGIWRRFKGQYQRLPPSLQMVGLQLWLPLVFVPLFCFSYIWAFHAPNPQGIRVDVVGHSAAVQTLAHETAVGSHGVLRVTVVSTIDTASVRRGDVAGEFVPGSPGHPATEIVASAEQYQLASVAKTSFASLAAAEHTTLRTEDLAPLPHRDAYGNSLFYLSLAVVIGGYMAGMFVGLMGGPLRHRHRFALVVGLGAVLSLIATVLAGPVLGAFDGHFAEVFAIGWATVVAAGLVVNGIAYFMGRFVAGGALLVFVFANVPSSGGAYPVQFVPEPFKWLNHIVIDRGVIPLLDHAVYDVGPGISRGVWTLAAYAAAGVAISLTGKPYAAWRAHRRAALGLPAGGMLATAQQQLAEKQLTQHPSGPGSDRPEVPPQQSQVTSNGLKPSMHEPANGRRPIVEDSQGVRLPAILRPDGTIVVTGPSS